MQKLFLVLICYLAFPAIYCNGQEPTWLWEKKVTGNHQANSHNKCKDVAYDNNGNFYITGDYRSPSLNFYGATLTNNAGNCFGGRPCTDGFLTKYSADGTVLWAKNLGGTKEDEGKRLAIDSEGNVYVVGSFYSASVNFGNGVSINNASPGTAVDFYIVKYNGSGTAQWARRAGLTREDMGYSVACDKSDNIVVTGVFSDDYIIFGDDTLINNNVSASNADIFVVKYTNTGDHVWAKRFGMDKNDYAEAVTTGNNNDIYITGHTKSAQLIFGNDTLTNTGINTLDHYLLKLDSLGNPMWAKSTGGNYDEMGMSICTDRSENIIVSGVFSSDTMFINTDTLVNAGASDIFIAKYDKDEGSVLWTKHVGVTGDDYAFDLATDSMNNIIMCGFYSNAIMLDTISLPQPSSPYVNDYVAQFDSNGIALRVKIVKQLHDPFYNLSSPESCIAIGEDNSIYFAGTCDYYNLIFDEDTLVYPIGSVSEIFVSKLGYELVTGAYNYTKSGQQIYPNPATNSVTVELQDIASAPQLIASVYSITGDLLLSQIANTAVFNIDVSMLSNGIYFISLFDGERIINHKLVKQ